MKFKFLLVALATVAVASAQDVQVRSNTQLLRGVESQCYSPVLNEDGTKVLFTSANYTGLKMYDLVDNVTTKIADDAMAGFDPRFSNDGQSVYFLSQTRENQRVYRTMNSYSFATKAERALCDKQRGMRSPVVAGKGVMIISDAGRQMNVSASDLVVYADKAELVIVKGGKETRISPVATPYTYLWTSLSPDKTKVLFYAGGVGAFVCDLEGNILGKYGKCESPAWCGNDYIVVCRSTDDGHQYESSKLELVKVDGTYSKELTKGESMSMSPSASADGSKIVYNTIDGRMFLMELNIK